MTFVHGVHRVLIKMTSTEVTDWLSDALLETLQHYCAVVVFFTSINTVLHLTEENLQDMI